MEISIKADQWIWVVVQEPGAKEQFLGQLDDNSGISYIPAFLEKEIAQQGLYQLARDQNHKYEVQAILYEDLAAQAAENGFQIFILDEQGSILKRIQP